MEMKQRFADRIYLSIVHNTPSQRKYSATLESVIPLNEKRDKELFISSYMTLGD